MTFFFLMERLLPGHVQRVEGGAEIRVDGVVPKVEREPVEADLAIAVSPCPRISTLVILWPVLGSGMLVALIVRS